MLKINRRSPTDLGFRIYDKKSKYLARLSLKKYISLNYKTKKMLNKKLRKIDFI
jgi:hypothetical protein